MPETGAVAIQVSVSGPDEEGRRELRVHSRPEGEEAQWAQNASGTLSTQPTPATEPLDTWPPKNAEPLEVDYLYDVLAEHGLQYGPTFQGLKAAWKDGEQIYAEVSLPEGSTQEAERFAIHPALLDSALHGAALGTDDSGELRLPFSWSEVSVRAHGASELRVALTPQSRAPALQVADGSGAPVASVGSLALRALDTTQLKSTPKAQEGLLTIEWAKATLPEGAKAPTDTEPLHCKADPKLPSPEAARKATEEALAAIQQWLADQSKADLRLALITEGAMATSKEESPDPATAAIWGLIRSAQSEHPGRFALIDSDGSEASEQALPAGTHPQRRRAPAGTAPGRGPRPKGTAGQRHRGLSDPPTGPLAP